MRQQDKLFNERIKHYWRWPQVVHGGLLKSMAVIENKINF